MPKPASDGRVALPEPDRNGTTSLETALRTRRSRREMVSDPIDLSTVSQLLWAAQGVTDEDGKRTAPSPIATFPLELFLTVDAGGVPDLDAGVYQYRPEEHALDRVASEPIQPDLEAAADQEHVGAAPIDLVITAIDERTAAETERPSAEEWVRMEAGHVGQNLSLQAEVLGLATVSVGGFDREAVAEALALDRARPLTIYPISQRKRD